jgi:hypothetical protein
MRLITYNAGSGELLAQALHAAVLRDLDGDDELAAAPLGSRSPPTAGAPRTQIPSPRSPTCSAAPPPRRCAGLAPT